MTHNEAWNLLHSFYGSEEDRKRERIGNIKLLTIILRGAEKNGSFTDREYRSILFFYEEELKKLKENKLDVKMYIAFPLAIIYFLLYLIPFGFLYSLGDYIDENIGVYAMYFYRILIILLVFWVAYKGIVDKKYSEIISKITNWYY